MTPSSGRGDGKGTSLRTALQSFRHRIMAEIFLFGIEKKFLIGADPPIGGGNPSDTGGICSPWRVLHILQESLANANVKRATAVHV